MQVRKEDIRYIETTPLRVVHHMVSALRGPLSPHWHEEIELDYVMNGSVIYIVNGVTYQLSQGEIAVMNSGAIHSGIWGKYERIEDTAAEVLTVLLDIKLFEPYCKGEIPIFQTFLREEENAALRRIMTDLGIAFLRGDAYYELFLSASALMLCHCLLVNHRLPAGEDRSVQDNSLGEIKKALRFIEEHCAEKLTLEDAASVMNYNPAYFSRRFHQLTGFTFSDYLNRCRVKAAASRLRDSDETVSDIAFSCGFPCTKSLITYFKRQFGTTPERYRREKRAIR